MTGKYGRCQDILKRQPVCPELKEPGIAFGSVMFVAVITFALFMFFGIAYRPLTVQPTSLVTVSQQSVTELEATRQIRGLKEKVDFLTKRMKYVQ